MMTSRSASFGVAVFGAALAVVMLAFAVPAGASGSFISQFSNTSTIASTVPHNGDVNPYGVVVVPRSVGGLTMGHVLVSNFNDRDNLQGTGTTIVDIAPDGTQKLFAHIEADDLPGRCPGGVGLTTALNILPGGWVV